ncbi:MAG: porin, partial [Limnobacter sp.]|nr:porin [Limnobacter sp.]
MNKKLLAAALGVAFAAPVFADSTNLTLYGRVHTSVETSSTDSTSAVAAGQFERGGSYNIDGNSSRLGVKGSEDLGGGLSLVFAYEFSVNSDTGGGINAGRHAYVGFKGSYGTVVVGQTDGGN